MPSTAGTLIDSISRRIRDASNTANTRALIRDVLDRVQVAINAHQSYVYREIPLATSPGVALYRLGEDVQGLFTVTSVEKDFVELDMITPWRNLWKLSPTWLTDGGPARGWAMIGKTLLAIYPVPAYSETLTVIGPAITTTLSADDVFMELRDEDNDIAREIATAIFLFRWRDLDMASPIVSRALDKLRLQVMSKEPGEAA